MNEFSTKIDGLKRDIADDLFQKKFKDLKPKFSAILTIIEKVVNGKDSFLTRKKRLDSLFYHCEEIIILINDVESVIFERAHLCLDFVSVFLIFHLGMLQIAEDDFELKDYKERRANAMKFYPILMKSYIDKAISNYVKAIVLQYHSNDSALKEFEEIKNEITGGSIYRVQNTGLHMTWDGSTVKDMKKDNMFYLLKDKKLVSVKPSFLLCTVETPLLCRALRNGISLKLEDLFASHIKNIEMFVCQLGVTDKKGDFDQDQFTYSSTEDLDSSSSTICSMIDSDKSISASQKFHEERVKTIDNLRDE